MRVEGFLLRRSITDFTLKPYLIGFDVLRPLLRGGGGGEADMSVGGRDEPEGVGETGVGETALVDGVGFGVSAELSTGEVEVGSSGSEVWPEDSVCSVLIGGGSLVVGERFRGL